MTESVPFLIGFTFIMMLVLFAVVQSIGSINPVFYLLLAVPVIFSYYILK